MDLSKLTPGPWVADEEVGGGSCVRSLDSAVTGWGRVRQSKDDAEFIALARNAFDVMMQRGWSPYLFGRKAGLPDIWGVKDIYEVCLEDTELCDDPFTALVEADKRYKEHYEL